MNYDTAYVLSEFSKKQQIKRRRASYKILQITIFEYFYDNNWFFEQGDDDHHCGIATNHYIHSQRHCIYTVYGGVEVVATKTVG